MGQRPESRSAEREIFYGIFGSFCASLLKKNGASYLNVFPQPCIRTSFCIRITFGGIATQKAADFSAAFSYTNLLFLTASIILTAEGASTTLMIISITKLSRAMPMTISAIINIPPYCSASPAHVPWKMVIMPIM